MKSSPKLRMIAGPNGSGKSTLLDFLSREFSFPLGFCLNPDELDIELRSHGRLYLGGWGTRIKQDALHAFMRSHPLGRTVGHRPPLVERNVLIVSGRRRIDYLTTLLCDFLRRTWLEARESFTFETVMSHPEKVALFRDARAAGYRTYLYYVCTTDSLINRERIAGRVKQGGHNVPRGKIESRFRRSLALLPKITALASRAYFFDNSGTQHRLIAEFDAGKLKRVESDLPQWFVDVSLK